MASSFFKDIGDCLAKIVDKVKKALEDEAIRRSIAEDLGLEPGESVPKVDLPQANLDSVNKYRSQANPDKEAFIILLNDVRAIYESVRSFYSALGVSGTAAQNQLLFTLFDLMAVNEVRLNEPQLFFVLQMLAALVEDSSILTQDEAAAPSFFKALGKAIEFLISPFYYLGKTFAGGIKDETEARQASDKLLLYLAAVASFSTKEIIYGWDGYDASFTFQVGDFKDPNALAIELRNAGNPVSQYLREQFSPATRQLLAGPDASGTASDTLQRALVDELNLVLKGVPLYDEQRFAKAKLTEQTLALVKEKPDGDDLIRLNRWLLEDTYAKEIGTSYTRLADQIADRMLTFAFPFEQNGSTRSELSESLALTLAFKNKSGSDLSEGLFLGVGGKGKVEIGLTDRWKVLLEASAEPAFSLLVDATNQRITAHGPADLPLNIGLVSIPDETDVTYAFPHRDETRVEIGQLALTFGFDGKNGGLKAQALRCALVIATKDHDGFLARVLPSDGLRVPFSFGVGFSTEKHFFTEGSLDWPTGHARPAPGAPTALARPAIRRAATTAAGTDGSQNIPNLTGTTHPELGMRTVIHIGKALLAVRLDHLTLGLSPASNSAAAQAKTEVSVSLAIQLGPVTAVVDRIGFQMGLSFPDSGGNIGFADFSFGFKAPSGVGIKVDADVVTGGGFLFIDQEKGQYAGFVQLSLYDFISLTAIGLITTKLPDGRKGFSFVILIFVENFRPLRIGPWSLTAIGGLVAINRTFNEEFVREGIKNSTLDDLMFPKDPIRNAIQIFGTLNNAFPPQGDGFIIGVMVQLCWGKPAIITMDLGVMVERGPRHRVIILGRVRSILPSEKHDLIRLQMNALGVIDTDQKRFALDAVLYDSRLVGKFPITGGMAMRLNWGADPMFGLSIGGFHPAFKPPANFPALERLAISMSESENLRMRWECYLAITSNTVQFGVKFEMVAKLGGFSIEGRSSWDVLIQFDPFGFIADYCASVQLKRGSHNLFKIKLEGQLSGPRPLHIKGRATFEIFWCDFSIGFDKTLVSGEPPPPPDPVNVTEQLVTALNEPRNWTGQLAEDQRRLVTLRETEAPNQIPLHPLGKLSVKQNVVPLELEISKFGNTTPADARLFAIKKLSVSGKEVSFKPEKDFFAPAQFLELTDDERLAAPSFEQMTAGISAGAESFQFTTNSHDILEDDGIRYETIIVDREFEAANGKPREQPAPAPISADFLNRHISLGAAARSAIVHSGTAKFRPAGSKNQLPRKGWTIASRTDGSHSEAPGLEAGTIVSYSESFQALQKLKAEDPARAATLMLVRVTRPRT